MTATKTVLLTFYIKNPAFKEMQIYPLFTLFVTYFFSASQVFFSFNLLDVIVEDKNINLSGCYSLSTTYFERDVKLYDCFFRYNYHLEVAGP